MHIAHKKYESDISHLSPFILATVLMASDPDPTLVPRQWRGGRNHREADNDEEQHSVKVEDIFTTINKTQYLYKQKIGFYI